jgi:hypothetical protein
VIPKTLPKGKTAAMYATQPMRQTSTTFSVFW